MTIGGGQGQSEGGVEEPRKMQHSSGATSELFSSLVREQISVRGGGTFTGNNA